VKKKPGKRPPGRGKARPEAETLETPQARIDEASEQAEDDPLPGFPGEGLRGSEWRQAEERLRELIAASIPQTKNPFLVSFASCCREFELLQKGSLFSAAPEVLRGSMDVVEAELWRSVRRRDESFFNDLARFAKKLFQPDWRSNEERILWAAFRLLEKDRAKPSREAVKEAVLAQGVRIEERDWSGYFKRCGLGFLGKAKPGRKPDKPIKRSSRGNPRNI
jgi:hypothetical protein